MHLHGSILRRTLNSPLRPEEIKSFAGFVQQQKCGGTDDRVKKVANAQTAKAEPDGNGRDVDEDGDGDE